MKYLRFFVFLSVISGIIISCDPSPCRSGNEIMMKMGLYTYKNNKLTDSLVDRLTLYGLDCLPDTPCGYFDKSNNVSTIGVFLSMVNDSARFEFYIDTITALIYDTSEIVHLDTISALKKPIEDTIFIEGDTLVRVTWIDSTVLGHNTDRFTVYYDRIQTMESPDCGVYIDFKIKWIDYTKKHFDTLIIMQPNVDENGYENIRVIF
ncbi:MAG: hypothetical protein JXB49_36220 [Bacteroidales bacterium]|nr:hypothetical protein [Bacteroidales bacterium]